MESREPGYYPPILTRDEVWTLAMMISSDDYHWSETLLRVAMCEAGDRSSGLYYFGSVSPQGDGGGLQLKYRVWGTRYDFDLVLTDPAYSIWAAWDITHDPGILAMYRGDGWGPWGCN